MGKINYKKIDAAENKAIKLLEKEYGVESYGFLNINLNPQNEQYESNLKYFRLLFDHPDKDYRMALWNSLMINSCDVKEEDFTDAELEFLKKCESAKQSYCRPYEVNINRPFKTRRLILQPAGAGDMLDYHDHLKNDGDFTLFTNMKYSKKNADQCFLNRPFFFAIYEKSENRMIGYTGISWNMKNGERSGVAMLEYYIFKPHRRKGYAGEAVCKLIEMAFGGKLYELYETNYRYVYKRKRAKVELIRATIRADNTASQKLVEFCGFCHTGTLHRDFFVEDRYTVDKEVYELSKEQYAELLH